MTQFFNRESEKALRRKLRNEMPKAEVILWLRLKNRQLRGYKFRRQVSVGPFVLDFFCPNLRIGIELDGDSHFQEGAQDKDRRRQKYIEKFDIRIIRFQNVEIYEDLDMVIEQLEREIESAERRWPRRPPLTPPSQGGDKN